MHETPIDPKAAFIEISTGKRWVPLSFVMDEKGILLISDSPHSAWASLVLRERRARIRSGRNSLLLGAELITSANEKMESSRLFTEKYGEEKFRRWFETPGKFLRLSGETAAPPKNGDYRTWLREEFDSIAEDYDRHILGNTVNRLLRSRSVDLMSEEFPEDSRLLEIGCGTGTETVSLLERGYRILATDISPVMLERLRSKVSGRFPPDQIELRETKASDAGKILQEYGPSSFDGIYSTYGAFNCEPDLSAVVPILHSLLKRKGKLILGIYNPFCISDAVGNILKHNPAGIFSRFRRPVPLESSRFCIDVWAYSPMYISRAFSGKFRTLRTLGVPVIIPPSDYTRVVDRFLRHFDMIDRIDSFLGRHWPFNFLGDHFLIVMERAA